MKKTAPTIIKDVTKTEFGITYRYLLTSVKSTKVTSFGMPLYSVEVIMTMNGRVTNYKAGDVFSDIGKAVVFFEKIVGNLATPIDMPYILEDMLI